MSDMTNAIDLREVWRVVRWRARMIALVALGAMAITAAGLALLPPKFKGTTVLLIDPRQPRVTTSEQVLAGIGSDAAAVESQVELIESLGAGEEGDREGEPGVRSGIQFAVDHRQCASGIEVPRRAQLR